MRRTWKSTLRVLHSGRHALVEVEWGRLGGRVEALAVTLRSERDDWPLPMTSSLMRKAEQAVTRAAREQVL